MLSFIVAFDPNGAIGKDGGMPWHIKEDLKLFKANTMYHHIIMGLTTYKGLPRKLVDRYMIVVTSKKDFEAKDVEVVNDFEAFLKQHENDEEEYIVCGGASIYKQAYPYCKKAYISFVKDSYEADTFFKGFNMSDWSIAKEVDYDQFVYRELIRNENN